MKNKFHRNILSLFSGTMLSQLIIVLTSPILTRIYTLEQFGQLAIFTSIISIFTNALSFKYEMSFINMDKKNDKLSLLKLIIISVLLTSASIVMILVSLEYWSVLNYFHSSYIYILLFLSLIGIGLYNALSYLAISESQINKISVSKIQQSSTLVIIQLISGFLNFKGGLIFGDSISRISGVTIFLKSLSKADYKKIIETKLETSIFWMKKYKDYAKFSVVSGMSNNFVMQSLPLILGIFYAQPLIGMLSIIQRVLVLPIKLISQSIRQAFMNEIMTYIHNGNFKSLKKLVIKIISMLTLITIIPAILGFILGETVLVFALGSNLKDSSMIINALIILCAFQFIFIPINQTLDLINKQKVQFIWQILRFIIVLLILILLPLFEVNFITVLYAYVIIMALFYVIQFILVIVQLNTADKV